MLALFRLGGPGAAPMFAGALIYVIGMFVCAVAFHFLLNNELARSGQPAATRPTSGRDS